jgi:hypothetical protein
MTLESIVRAVKREFPLRKPWLLGKRRNALRQLKVLRDAYANDENTWDFIEKVLTSSEDREDVLAHIERYHTIDSSIIPTISRSYGSIIEQEIVQNLPFFSQELPTLLQEYNTECGVATARGILAGINQRRYATAEEVNNIIPEIRKEETKAKIKTAAEYSPSIGFAVAKEITVEYKKQNKDRKGDIEKFDSDFAKDMYAQYKNVSENAAAEIILSLSYAQWNPHEDIGIYFADKHVAKAINQAPNREVEWTFVYMIPNYIDHTGLTEKDFSFLGTDTYRDLVSAYKDRFGFTELLETVLFYEEEREAILSAFMRDDVQELFTITGESGSKEYSDGFIKAGWTINAVKYVATKFPEEINSLVPVLTTYKDTEKINIVSKAIKSARNKEECHNIIQAFEDENVRTTGSEEFVDGIVKYAPELARNVFAQLKKIKERAPNMLRSMLFTYNKIKNEFNPEEVYAFAATVERDSFVDVLEAYNDQYISHIIKGFIELERRNPSCVDDTAKILIGIDGKSKVTVDILNNAAYFASLKVTDQLSNYLEGKGIGELEGITELCQKIGLDSQNLRARLATNDIDLVMIQDTANKLEEHGLQPTAYLIEQLYDSADKPATIASWQQTITLFKEGNFDAESELHWNLEYTRLIGAVATEKGQHDLSDSIKYDDFSRIARPSANPSWSRPNNVKQAVLQMAGYMYTLDPIQASWLVQTVLEKEKSKSKIKLLACGFDVIQKTNGLGEYFVNTARQEPKVAYKMLESMGLLQPFLDQQAYKELSEIFTPEKLVGEYGMPLQVRNAISRAGLEADPVLAGYCHTVDVQGKALDARNVGKVARILEQIARDEAVSIEKPDGVHAQRRNAKQVKLEKMVYAQRKNTIDCILQWSYERELERIVGSPVSDVEITEDMTNAISTYHHIGRNRELLADIIKASIEGEPHRIYDTEPNRKMKARYEARGIDVDRWVKGVTRIYSPQQDKDVQKAKETVIMRHRNEAVAIYARAGHEVTPDNIFDSYGELAAEMQEDVRVDLKTQLQAIRSLETQTYDTRVGKIKIYTEQDPLKVLQMGNVVSGSCLGLGKGNTWSAVANAADINKAILYAEMNGKIVARKLVALNEEGEIVQYQTFNNRLDLMMEPLFYRHIERLSEVTKAKRGDGGTIPHAMTNGWYNDRIVPFPTEASVLPPERRARLSA